MPTKDEVWMVYSVVAARCTMVSTSNHMTSSSLAPSQSYLSFQLLIQVTVMTTKSNDSKMSVVYSTSYGFRRTVYTGETGRGLDTTLWEHRAHVCHHRTSNAFLRNVGEAGHLLKLKGDSLLYLGMDKKDKE